MVFKPDFNEKFHQSIQCRLSQISEEEIKIQENDGNCENCNKLNLQI